jgi:hypothetical protein
MEPSKEKRLGTGRVAFLARIGVFTVKINAGHTMRMVYEDHQDELGISYSQFVNYVNRYIRKIPNETKPNQAKETPATKTGDKESNKPKEAEFGQPEFKSSGKRDDLFKPKS